MIEMKNRYGTGRLNDDQIKYLNNLKLLGFKTLVSNDYTQIILQINDYMNEVRINCPSCIKHFRNKITLNNHLNIFHSIGRTWMIYEIDIALLLPSTR